MNPRQRSIDDNDLGIDQKRRPRCTSHRRRAIPHRPFNKKKEFTAPMGSEAEGASFRDDFTKADVKDEWADECRVENPQLLSFLHGIRGLGNEYNYC